MKRVMVIISGDVQGVGFRAWVKQKARGLQLTGWVKNREDGTVEVIAEGQKISLDEFIKQCKQGPEVAWVERVDVKWLEPSGEYTEFQVYNK